LAIEDGHYEVVELLRKSGAKEVPPEDEEIKEVKP
jgi:hypothetical protein